MARHGGLRNNAGRPKGSQDKVPLRLKEMILQALDQVGGKEYLAARAVDCPNAFLTLLGKVLPMQVQGDPDHPVHLNAILVPAKADDG